MMGRKKAQKGYTKRLKTLFKAGRTPHNKGKICSRVSSRECEVKIIKRLDKETLEQVMESGIGLKVVPSLDTMYLRVKGSKLLVENNARQYDAR